ncbi:very short patch repair endonuclease [Paenibacillus amylolyticus]|uniref:Very short patch repair endonuclease n=1 Tax=Paenibacillus amylolyticus TaxID=1451 RepID=A0A5M9WNC1_PAEAM|nr:very short patch repair endonuclease [Paenibacillus amylolyticus]KAA8783084.1 very short patch repair endonuclease [Paenibacillus amylolyticus]
MVDNLSPENRKKNMSAIRSTGTKLEDKVSRELWRKGFRFRRNSTSLYGKPDISIKKYKIVIFIDSCFWHGCKIHGNIPKSNQEYWVKKLVRNKQRDTQVNSYYESIGWSLLRIWEHKLKKDEF